MLQIFAPGKVHTPVADHIAKHTASIVRSAAEDKIMWVIVANCDRTVAIDMVDDCLGVMLL